MGRFLALILMCIVSLSLTAGAMAHAAEPIGCLDAEVAADLGHASGDRDQVPSDSGKATPHHHGGCQGHQIGEPVKDGFTAQSYLRTSVPMLGNAQFRVSTASAPAYRPPIA